MSPREIWCNEAQERYVLAIAPASLPGVRTRSARASAARSRWSARPMREGRLVVDDPHFGNTPVDMPLDVLLGKPPKMTRDVRARRAASCRRSTLAGIDAARRRLSRAALPAVADKTFLITIGDRTRRRPVRARPDGRSVAGAGGRRAR